MADRLFLEVWTRTSTLGSSPGFPSPRTSTGRSASMSESVVGSSLLAPPNTINRPFIQALLVGMGGRGL